MAREKKKNKATGRIIFLLIIIVTATVFALSNGNTPPEVNKVVKVIEHDALL